VKADIQKWYPSHGISQYLAHPAMPTLEMSRGKTTAMKANTAASDTITRGFCCSEYRSRLKCQMSWWPTEAKNLRGVPRKNL